MLAVRKIPLMKAMPLAAALMLWSGGFAGGAEVTVAVASNFRPAMEALKAKFETTSEHRLTLVFGSTGKLYAQITHGAPFDVFLAADIDRPKRLELEGHAVSDSRFTYAIGKLVLWSPRPDYVDDRGLILERGDFRHLAIANPQLAPYGLAAREVLQARGLWDQLSPRLVHGENISQTFQFIQSGNAELGFVAWSQVKQPDLLPAGSYWLVPQELYRAIEQQAVLLRDDETSRSLLRFMRGNAALNIIRNHGYAVP